MLAASSQRVVRLELHHRPDDKARGRKNLFKQRELRQQVRLDAFAGFVTRPQSVAKRFDHVIGGDGDVRGAVLDHAHHGRQDPSNGGDLPPIRIPRRRQSVVVAE